MAAAAIGSERWWAAEKPKLTRHTTSYLQLPETWPEAQSGACVLFRPLLPPPLSCSFETARDSRASAGAASGAGWTGLSTDRSGSPWSKYRESRPPPQRYCRHWRLPIVKTNFGADPSLVHVVGPTRPAAEQPPFNPLCAHVKKRCLPVASHSSSLSHLSSLLVFAAPCCDSKSSPQTTRKPSNQGRVWPQGVDPGACCKACGPTAAGGAAGGGCGC